MCIRDRSLSDHGKIVRRQNGFAIPPTKGIVCGMEISMMESSRWKKILPELLAVILCLGIMCVGISLKEGYHMDELLSFELANARYNPWIVPTQPEGRLAKFVREEIQGDSFPETVSNLTETVKDVLQNRRNSKPVSYTHLDVYKRQAEIISSIRERIIRHLCRIIWGQP